MNSNQDQTNQINQQTYKVKMHRKVRKCKLYLMSLIYLLLTGVLIEADSQFKNQQNQQNQLTNQLINYNQLNDQLDQQEQTINNSYYFEINENTIENQLIGTVQLLKGLIYRFSNSQSIPEFKFDSITGHIYTTKVSLDRERQQFYNLIILSNQPTTNPIQVKIKIKDLNDNKPYWLNDSNRQLSFSETAPIGSKHLLDTAIDLDDEDRLRYELLYCTDYEQCSCTNENNLVNFNRTFSKNINSDVNSDNVNKTVQNVHKPFKLNFNQMNSILNIELVQRLDRELISTYNCKLCVFDLKNQSNSLILNIQVSDVNDCLPIFDQSNYSTTINHNLKKDDHILTVHAIDLDESNTPNSDLTYSLQDSVKNDFYINKITGSIYAAHDGLPVFCSSLKSDDSQWNSQLVNCVFTVICEDNGSPKQQSKTYVTIYLSLTDNQHAPQIKILYFNKRFVQYASIDQTAIHGSAVAAISVFDPDTGQNGQTKLDIISGNELEHFYLDSDFSNTGSYVIRVNQNFTQSINSQLNSTIKKPNIFNLTIKATDYGHNPLSSTQNLIIKISELSDNHKPVFNKQTYKVELVETSPIGSFICLVNAIDYDQQSIVYFYSLSGNNSDYFHIDSQTGMVTLAKQIDRELINDIELKVYVRDTQSNSELTSARILIKSLDVNDHYPKMLRKNTFKPNYEIVEDEKNNKTTLKITEGNRLNYEFMVTDDDQGENGSVIVELLYDYQGLFNLNTTTLLNRKEKLVHLYSTEDLDYETTKNYELLIVLSDQGIPKLFNQHLIQIDVLDLDDQSAIVYPKHYFINLTNSTDLTEILIQIQTIDQDKKSVMKYFFNFNHNHKNLNLINSLISIDEFTGNIHFSKKSINLNSFPKYLPVNVTCDSCDRLNQQATIHFYINSDLNNEFNKNLTKELNTSTLLISELSEPKIIRNLTFSNEYDLLIVDGDADQTFTILNGQLILTKKLDYEKISEYNLTICAFNSDLFKLTHLIIKIKNENTQQPEFKRPFVYLEILRDVPKYMSIYELNAIDSDDQNSLYLSSDLNNNFYQTSDKEELTIKKTRKSWSSTVYHFINSNHRTNSTLIKNGNYMFRINRNQLELNVNLFERKFIQKDDGDSELVYTFKEDLIYKVSIQAKDLNSKNSSFKNDLQLNRKIINIFIKIKNPVINKFDLFTRSLELIRSFYELNIEESKQINSKLLKFDLIYNKQLDGQLKFDLINDDLIVQNLFAIFPDGTLYLKNKLDREQNENFILRIAVSLKSDLSTSFSSLSTTTSSLKTKNQLNKILTVLIHVIDNNNCAPKFEKEIYNFYLIENSSVNTSIGTVKANDKDLNSNSLVNYNFLPNNFQNYIGLNSITGQLYLKSPVDYELIKQITFEIEAEDQAIYEKRLKSKCKVKIQVIDENDCSPCFVTEIYDSDTGSYLCSNKLKQQISIMKNLKPNSTIYEFRVKDQDSSNEKLKFTLIESEYSSNFNLNENTGHLRLIKNLDQEINESIELLIKVDDGVHDAFNRFIIKLKKMKDNLPIWRMNKTDLFVFENTEPGTNLLTLDAIDLNAFSYEQLDYEIVNVKSIKSVNSELCRQSRSCVEAECFKIENNQLVLTNYLDYENEKTYEINLTAINSNGLRSEILTIKLNVINVNDCSPKLKKATANELQLNEETISIFENIKINTVIVILDAFDCDQDDELTYALVKCQILGTYHKKCPLELDNKTGKLVTIDNLDYEEIKRINLKIEVTDLNGQTDLKELSILIENLNDNSPKIGLSTSFVIIRQKQQPIDKNEILVQIQAIDLDHDRIIYRIQPTDDNQSNSVYVDENDGFIYAKNRFESNTELKFNVMLIDEGNLFTNELIHLVILFVDKLDTIDLVFDVFENEPIGFLIYKFKCGSTCKYYLNTCNKLFNVDENGELRTESNLDRETKSTYYFDVFSLNSIGIQVFKIKINVLDRNDNSPKSLGNSNERIIRVKENERLKSVLFDLSTIVTDFDLNTQFQFGQLNCLASFNKTRKVLNVYDNPFLIESNTGKIILNRELDREREEKYELQFSISDGLFKINDRLTILIIDVNDSKPTFSSKFYSFNVIENTKNRTIIGKVEAIDLDFNSPLKYKIISEQNDSPFEINEKTGTIHLIRDVDYETDNHLYISICQASDGEFTSEPVTLYFNILNQNDNQPLFERTDYKFIFNENEKVNNQLFCIQAHDADNDQLIYKMHENEKDYQFYNHLLEEFYFEVNNQNGCVKLLKKFNIEEKDQFQFKINVSDGQYHDVATVQLQVIKTIQSNRSVNAKVFRKNLMIKLNRSNLKIGETIHSFNENVQLLNDYFVPFKINQFNELILTNQIDNLKNSTYQFQLNYSKSIQNVTIAIVLDQIEPIKFERNLYELDIFEDHKMNKPIMQLNLINFEFKNSDKLSLKIISGNQNEQFLIHKNELLLAKQLDYEKIKRFLLNVQIIDHNRFDQSLSNDNQTVNQDQLAVIQINVLNVIDERPIFLDSPYYFKWCENSVGELGRFIAKSEYDLQSNTTVNNLKYILKNNEYDFFNLDTNTGVLSVIKMIDKESLKSPIIELKILVIDELNADLQNEVLATIEILNLNDNKPIFSKLIHKVNLNENVLYSKGFSFLNSTAKDLDNDLLEYRLIDCKAIRSSKDQCKQIHLNELTGELYAGENLLFDREQEELYKLIISASDAEFETTSELELVILDENDSRPKLNLDQSKSNLIRKQLIKEDQLKIVVPYQYFTSDMTESEQLFLFGLNVEDHDQWNTLNSKINFKLVSQLPESMKLKLNRDNGIFLIQNSFDDEKQQNKSVQLQISIQDCNLNHSLENKINIDLELFDFNALKWMTIFEPILNDLQISESAQINSTIYEFKLIDLKLVNSIKPTIDLNILGGDYDNRFKIKRENSKFKLILNKQLDYEYVQNYLIYLEATAINESSDKINFQILELNIKLINEEDNEPQFSKSIYNATILEEQEANLFVIQLEAFDLDNRIGEQTFKNTVNNLGDEDDFNRDFNFEKINLNQNEQFKFELLTDDVPFRVDQYSGAVFTTKRIDREETGDYFELIVQVQDNGGLKSQAQLNVHVLDVNDNPPRFNQLSQVNVSENEQIGAFIVQIKFTDRDKPNNNSIHKFSISDDRFTIDQFGNVYLAKKIDYTSDGDEITTIITVNDGEWKQNTALTIYIKRENNSKPKFQFCQNHFGKNSENCIYHFDLDDEAEIGEAIGMIKAQLDFDKGASSLVSYRFTEESNLFRIDEQTGQLFKLSNYLNLENRPSFSKFYVEACDNALLPKCSLAEVYLIRNERTLINLPIPIDLINETILYRSEFSNSSIDKTNRITDSEGFGFCKTLKINSDKDFEIFKYENQSLIFIGEKMNLELGDEYECRFWSLFELQKFTNLKIIITKRNQFKPEFLTVPNQISLNETFEINKIELNDKNIKTKQIYQFTAIDNDSTDGFNNEITFSLNLISVQFNENALKYYFKKFKNNSEDENFFSKSIELLISNNQMTKYYLDPFKIHPKTGQMHLEHDLDYELITSYKYQIAITDNALFSQKSSNQLLNIQVNNLNDNSALFVNGNGLTSELELKILENNQPKQIIDKITIIDFDDPTCMVKKFKILNNSSDSQHFRLDQDQLIALSSLDHKKQSKYVIYLIDQNNNQLKITIKVLNANKLNPKFVHKFFEFNLLEQTKLNSIISNLNHTIEDHNNRLFEFQLLKPINFGIDLDKFNNLIVIDQIDFESFSMNEIYKQTLSLDNVSLSVIKLKFTLLVKLKDKLVKTSQDYDRAELLINLIDLNEPPKFERSTVDCLLVRTNGQCTYQFVNECKVNGIDLDQNDYIRYRLLNHNHLFSIDEHKGKISLINCNPINLHLNLPSDLDVVAIDSSDSQSKVKVNLKLNWRIGRDPYQSNDRPSVNANDYLSFYSKTTLNATTIDKDLINKWCSKGKKVPESTARMRCYRKSFSEYCCECKSNYQGINGCNLEDLCSLDDDYCQNGGLCKQINAKERICLCRQFRGARCEQALTACNNEKNKCGVNGVCQIVKPFGHRCNCLDYHTFGHECSSFSLGIRPNAYIRLNTSLNEVNDELSMTFASFYRINHKTSIDDNNQEQQNFGQLMIYNHGQPNMQTGRTDFLTLELYDKYLLLRIGGSHQSKFIELKIYANKYDLLDGKYYKFSLIRNRKIAHISIYSCERLYLDNQLNCNNLLNQSSISFNQASFHFNGNPLFIGGLDYAYNDGKLFAQKTKGHVLAQSNFVGCLYKAVYNGVKINEYIAEKSFVDPICRPLIDVDNKETLSQLNGNVLNKDSSTKITDNLPAIEASKKESTKLNCGKESIYCKQNWFENKCGCSIQINNSNQTTNNMIYESNQPCNNLCEIQLNKKSLIKLKLSDKWSTIMKSQTYRTRLEEFVIRFYLTNYATENMGTSSSNLWTNGYLSIRISSNGTIYMINDEHQFEQSIKLNGKFKLNQWNTFVIRSTGEQLINDQMNRFNSQLFKNNLRSMIIGGNLAGCISHIIINGHLVLDDNNHLYELHTENVNEFGCKGIFESSKFSLDSISIGIILIIMFFVILLLVISTSFMLFNTNSKRQKSTSIQRRSTLPTINKHSFHQSNKTITPHHSLTQMINNSYAGSNQDYYEEPFYYGSDYFKHNEKLAASNLTSNQFNLSNRSQF